MLLNNNPVFIPHPDKSGGGRVFIGQVVVAEVYNRTPKADLFNKSTPKFDFHIGIFMKHQPEGQWLEHVTQDEYIFNCNSIEEGMQWLLEKLNDNE